MMYRTKKAKQTHTDKLKRNMGVRHDMLAHEQTDTEDISPFVVFIAVFIRHGFGKCFLKGGWWRVVFRMVLFCLIGWGVHFYLPIFPQWMMQNMLAAIALFPFMGAAFLVMFLFRQLQKGLNSLRYIERHNWHSGTSYFLPLGKWWIRQLNRGAIGIQRVWNGILSKNNKFTPREDVFYNDVGVTRHYIEPLFALLLAVLFFAYLKLPLIRFWFLGTAIRLNRTAKDWLEKYYTSYDNLQDQELVMKGSAKLLDRSTESGQFWSDTQRLIDSNDQQGLDNYMKQFEAQANAAFEHKKNASQPKEETSPAPEDDFSLDAALEALKAKKNKNKAE